MTNIILVFSSLVFVCYGLETPIIGILTQETYIVSHLFPGEYHDSYISASYVKFIESGGGRVVPVWIGQSEDYYKRVVSYTNGVLFPGGGTFFNETNGYAEAANLIYKWAIDANKKGIYYPILGTCLGMEVIPFAAIGKDIRVNCISNDVALPLNFTKGYQKSKLFSKAPKDVINNLSTLNVTFNYHHYCLTRESLKRSGILADWKILSENYDDNKLRFVSAMESKNYPLYGVQFHPEKNPFEFEKRKIPHSKEAVIASQYFSNFFVDEARKNNNSVPSKSMEQKALIYNFNPRYTGLLPKSSYEQIYLFNKTEYHVAQFL